MPRRSWTTEYKKLVAQRAQSETVSSLSKELDIAESVLSAWKKKFGHTKSAPGPTGVSDDVRTAALARLQRKESPSKVAKDIGVSRTTLHRWKRESGIKLKRFPVFSEAVKADAVKSYDTEPPVEICKRLKINLATLRRWRIEAGLPMRKAGKPSRALFKLAPRPRSAIYSPEFRAEAVKRYDTEPTAALCKELGIGMSTLRGWRIDAGLPMRRQGTRLPEKTVLVMGVGPGLVPPLQPSTALALPSNGEVSKAVISYNDGMRIAVRTGMALAEIWNSTDRLMNAPKASFDRATLSEYIHKIRALLSNLG